VAPVEEVDQDVAAAARAAGGAGDPAAAAWAAHRVRAAAADALSAARRLSWRLADALGRERDRGIKQTGASLDVLQGLEVPGVLVEVGFLDHPQEGEELAAESGRERIAAALAEAVLDIRARERRARTDPAITAQKPAPGR
jgi:N-acetylmuramoyl-L-alanine amidase